MTVPAPVDAERTRRALTEAAGFGPYFTVDAGPRGDYVPAAEFYRPQRLHDLIGVVGRRLATGEARVAASSLQYELAERLWSVVIGSWAADGVVVDLATLALRSTPAGTIELHLGNPLAEDYRGHAPARTAAAIASSVVQGQLLALHHGLRSAARVADGLLWGNAATALVLATQTILASYRDDRVVAVSSALLEPPPLADRLDGDITGTVTRRTCCLYYRTSARRTCGDCPLSGSVVARSRR